MICMISLQKYIIRQNLFNHSLIHYTSNMVLNVNQQMYRYSM